MRNTLSFIETPELPETRRAVKILNPASSCSFEETAHFILFGNFPNKHELELFSRKISHQNYHVQCKILRMIKEFPSDVCPLLVLQSCVTALACFDSKEKYSCEIEKIFQLLAQIPAMLGVLQRRSQNMPALDPQDHLSFIENLFYVLNGFLPQEEQKKALETFLIAQMSDPLGFTPAVLALKAMAATRAGVYTCVAAAFGALSQSGFFATMDFCTEPLYKGLGVSPALYSALTVMAQVVGWCARVLELHQSKEFHVCQ